MRASVKLTGSERRGVLVISPYPDPSLLQTLQTMECSVESIWPVTRAERWLADHVTPVVLLDLTGAMSHDRLDALAALALRCGSSLVALVDPGQSEDPAVRSFIVDYCFDYITTPYAQMYVAPIVGHAFGFFRLHARDVPSLAAIDGVPMIGNCDAMRKLNQDVAKCAKSSAPVFIFGESGTGKELTARAIHDQSRRKNKPFVAINCAAIPPTLVQSELFGYERGAFTGADKRRVGRIEAAEGGTLLLDEIGDMPFECQAILLRFLQEGTIERLGGSETTRVDVRIISATHVNLRESVTLGTFRADLYHRLCVLQLSEPPLRERGADIMLLAEHFLERSKIDTGRKIKGFAHDAVSVMHIYPWPGNVRELVNRIRHAAVMADGHLLTAADMGLGDVANVGVSTLSKARSDAERAAISDALYRNGHRLAETAEDLGVSRVTLYRLMKSFDKFCSTSVTHESAERPTKRTPS